MVPEWLQKFLKLPRRGVRTVKHYISCTITEDVEIAKAAAASMGFAVSVERLEDPLVYIVTLAHQVDPDSPAYYEESTWQMTQVTDAMASGRYDGMELDMGYADPPGWKEPPDSPPDLMTAVRWAVALAGVAVTITIALVISGAI